MSLIRNSELPTLRARRRLSELMKVIHRFVPLFDNYRMVLAELERRGVVKKHSDGTYSIC